jgi:hypothetical protein
MNYPIFPDEKKTVEQAATLLMCIGIATIMIVVAIMISHGGK